MADDNGTGDIAMESAASAPAGTEPEFYLNGIEIGFTLSDVRVRAMVDGRPACLLHMSFTTAKTLAEHLDKAVSALEKRTGRPIMTMDDMNQSLEGHDGQ